MARVTYGGATATHEWLRYLATQPGEVWVEVRDDKLTIVHEFDDQRGGDHERSRKTVDDYKRDIKQALRHDNGYSTQVIQYALIAVDKEFGVEAANKLIDECKLQKYGWSKKEVT